MSTSKASQTVLPARAKEFAAFTFPKLSRAEKTQALIAASYPAILPELPWGQEVQQEIIEQHPIAVAALPANGGGIAMLEGGSSSNCIPAGFYKVVRSRVHLLGLTNGTALSGAVGFEVEIGWPDEGELLYAGFEPSEASNAPSGVRYYHVDETNRSPLLVWETARVPNGTCVLKPTAFFSGNIELGGTPAPAFVGWKSSI